MLLSRWLLLLAAICPTAAWADYAFNMTRGVTTISEKVYDLHMTILYICMGIGVVVFGIMFYAILRHRHSSGRKAATFHESTAVEIAWTLIPIIILVAMAIPATKTVIEMQDTENADLTIKVTGYQWKWHYSYMEDDIAFFSNLSTPIDQIKNIAPKGEYYLLEVDRPLVVPVGRKIRFLGTANDVIHSWWVPALGFKKDTIPGFINESWAYIHTPGTYRGQCAELCGVNHGYMPIVIEAKSEDDFRAWVTQQKKAAKAAQLSAAQALPMEELMAKGEKVYNSVCAVCHQANGQGLPGVFPGLKSSKIATGPIATHIAVVLRGVPGTAMQAFGGQLDDGDLAAVITYERNAWGNNTGDILQAADIQKAR